MTDMARGPSGRIVIEMDPALKRDLHSVLAAQGSSLKDWFIERAKEHIAKSKSTLTTNKGSKPKT
jgi:hypothetical protein